MDDSFGDICIEFVLLEILNEPDASNIPFDCGLNGRFNALSWNGNIGYSNDNINRFKLFFVKC